MKAKLDGHDVEVIILDPPAAFAVEQGVMGGVGGGVKMNGRWTSSIRIGWTSFTN